jgi:amidase
MHATKTPAFALLIGGLLASLGATEQGRQAVKTPGFEFEEATIPQLQEALAAGTLTSRGLVEAYLARIEAYDKRGPALNALSALGPNARAEADALDAERKAKGPRGPLHGIPVIVKDNYETSDMQTAAGSLSLAGWVPPADAFLVRRLRAAGAILLAKSNMHEFAYGIETIGSLFGHTRNPYAPDRNPGGSSGGTGAAIAASFAAAGLGSDTCGSIRIPCSRNGLVGIRGTQGLASRSGIVPLCTTQDIGGPMGRSVTDVALVLDVIVGYDPDDASTAESVGRIPKTYTGSLRVEGLRGARVGALTRFLQGDPEVVGVVRQALDEMRRQGAEVVEAAVPDLDALITDRLGGFLILRQDFKFDLDAYLARRPTAPMRSLEQILASGKVSAAPQLQTKMRESQGVASRDTKEYLEHQLKRSTLRQAILKGMADQRLDALAYATVSQKPAALDEEQKDERSCRLAANSGLPAISVPAGFTAEGTPVGVELLGRPWAEDRLIELAYAFEQATHHRHPPASTPPLPR